MFDYTTLRLLWWLLLGALLTGFAIADGFDLGLGASIRLIGRTDAERHTLLRAIEPYWEGNQVWLITGVGVVFAAWPLLYAAALSGFYPLMFLLLAALILRPVGFGFRDKINDARWRNIWDWVLVGAGAIPALVCGVVFGNLFLGLPFHFDGWLRPVFSGGFLYLFRPFALLAGVVSLSMLLLHGATYAASKVAAPLALRAHVMGQFASIAFLLSFLLAGLWLASIEGYRIVGMTITTQWSDPTIKAVTGFRGAWFENYRIWPWLWAAPISAVLCAVGAHVLLLLHRARLAFVASCVVQAATILTAGAALFPFLLPSSTHPSEGLSVWDAASSIRTLQLMLVTVSVLLPVILIYSAWVYRVLRGRIAIDTSGHQHGPQHY